MIYLDNAATTEIFKEVVSEYTDSIENFPGNPSSSHQMGKKAAARFTELREKVKKLLSIGDTHEVIFASGSVGNNAVVSEISSDEGITVCGILEHPSIYKPVTELPKNSVIKCNREGLYDLDELANVLKEEKVDLVSLMLVSNELGCRQNVEKAAELISLLSPSSRFHVDASQGISYMTWPQSIENIDFITMSAHKFHGPVGSGILICRKNSVKSFFVKGGEQQTLISGTINLHGAAATVRALELTLRRRNDEFLELCSYTSEKLGKVKDLEFTVSKDNRVPWIFSISLPGLRGEIIARAMDMKNIAISWSSACGSSKGGLSRSLKSVGARMDRGYVRVAVSVMNTKDEIDVFITELQSVVEKYAILD
ncbi:MAG: aminotransferase class V-fold PLP-dependent enzyme [Deltaproteobacteria bacterium]|nr:aminotransferase class V-fold PLP-dependent enzyme [Deltaproteobacteria bacterium]